MAIKNADGRELTPEEIEELSGGYVLVGGGGYFKCCRCGERTPTPPLLLGTKCHLCGYTEFELVVEEDPDYERWHKRFEDTV
jgi:hypothetical protein